MTEKELRDYKDGFEINFNEYIGTNVLLMEDGYAEGELVIEEHHLNPWNTLHGGVMASFADIIGSCAVRSLGIIHTTTNISLDCLRSTEGCRKLIARARVAKAGNNLCVTNVQLCDETDRVIAQAVCTYFVIEKL